MNLTCLDFTCSSEDDFLALSVMLANVRQITTLGVSFRCEVTPEGCKAFESLKWHPLTKLTLRFCSMERGFVPFENGLPPMPNLQNLELMSISEPYCRIEHRTHIPRLINLSSIVGRSALPKRISISGFDLDFNCNRALAHILKDVESLCLSSCRLEGRNSDELFNAIDESITLKDLELKLPPDADFSRGLATAVSRNHSLKNICIHGYRWKVDRWEVNQHRGVASLLDAFALYDPVQNLSLLGFNWGDHRGSKLTCYLAATTTLRFLSLNQILEAGLFDQICSVVARNVSIESVELKAHVLGSDIEEGLQVLNSRIDYSFNCVKVGFQREKPAAFLRIITGLQPIGAIQTLHLEDLAGSQCQLSVRQTRAFLKSLEKNLSLISCPFETTVERGESEEEKVRILEGIRAIYFLNRCGRRHCTGEKFAKASAVNLLADVCYNLDAIHYFVRQNPQLCERDIKKQRNSRPRIKISTLSHKRRKTQG